MGHSSRTRRTLPVLQNSPATESHVVAPGESALRIGVLTLGCDKNTVDSERILAGLLGAGARITPDLEQADVVVVNTCGFIDVAKEESIEAILDAVRLKQAGRVRAVVAMGCLVQRYGQELRDELPEVDLLLGLTEADRLVPELRARGLLADGPLMERPLRALATSSRHSSYLKVSEGCDHTCAFCAIPLMRGRHRSTPIERLVMEAQELEARGVVELNLISQDTTWYGRDLVRGHEPAEGGGYFVGREFAGMAGVAGSPPVTKIAARTGRGHGPNGQPAGAATRHGLLPRLLRTLLDETGIPWLRLFYMYPSGIHPELIDLLAREPRIVRYLDMPIQHGVDRVLERMRRPERQATIRDRVQRLRDALPGLVLRTTIIVGFPGETDADFETLLEFVEEMRFERLGAFAYSSEEGTRAADMDGQVPEELRRERLERLLDLQRSISLEANEALIGQRATVLVDAAERGTATARTSGQAPEIDGIVRVHGASELRAGEFREVEISAAGEDDLVAHVAGRAA